MGRRQLFLVYTPANVPVEAIEVKDASIRSSSLHGQNGQYKKIKKRNYKSIQEITTGLNGALASGLNSSCRQKKIIIVIAASAEELASLANSFATAANPNSKAYSSKDED